MRTAITALVWALCSSVSLTTSGAELPASRLTVQDIRPKEQPIVIGRGLGTWLHLSGTVTSVFVADPEIADVRVASPSSIFVNAKKGGETVLYAANDEGQVLLKREIQVPRQVVVMRAEKIDTGESSSRPINLVIPLSPPQAEQSTAPAAPSALRVAADGR